MWECISSTTFFVLVNGFLSCLFGASRGLWQGDPLSPFLFTIMAEPLGALLVRAMDYGLIKGFEASWNGKQSTCLQFAIYIICLVQQ